MESTQAKDVALLVARILLSALFLISGWAKLVGFAGTVGYMTSLGLPFATLSAVLAIVVELPLALALLAGVRVTPIALIIAGYAIATAVIGHAFWTITDPAQAMMRYDAQMHFFKNLSIAGGLLALAVAGAGRYALSFKKN